MYFVMHNVYTQADKSRRYGYTFVPLKIMKKIVFAAQEQALSMNNVQHDCLTGDCLVSCCSALVQKEYKPRHDCVAICWRSKLVYLTGSLVETFSLMCL